MQTHRQDKDIAVNKGKGRKNPLNFNVTGINWYPTRRFDAQPLPET